MSLYLMGKDERTELCSHSIRTFLEWPIASIILDYLHAARLLALNNML